MILDGPASYGVIDVGTTAVEAKVGEVRQNPRKIVTIQPVSADVYYGFDDKVTINTGTRIRVGETREMIATEKLPVFLVSELLGTKVRITEVD